MRANAIWLLVGLAVVAGCTGHASDYASQGYPDSTVVGATRDVYTATNSADRLGAALPDLTVPAPAGTAGPPSDTLRADRAGLPGGGPAPGSRDPAEIAELRRIEGQITRGTARFDPTTFTPAGVPIPVADRPSVLRIWVAPWRDAAGDTIVAGYVFANTRAAPGVAAAPVYPSASPNYLQSVETIEARAAPAHGGVLPPRPGGQAGAQRAQPRRVQPVLPGPVGPVDIAARDLSTR